MRILVVDAFTDDAFGGNPAGVVLLDDVAHRPDEDVWMQRVAAEMRHSETAFVRRRADGTYDLRWFTPSVEVDLCGHATLASAHALASSGTRDELIFHTRSGVLRASSGADGSIGLDFPARPAEPIATPAGLAEALGVDAPGVYGNGMDILVEVASAEQVASLTPDLVRLAQVETRGVCVTAAGGTPADDADFVSRFFAPLVGVDEDPVTGSAHCMLAPFWAARLRRAALTGRQLSARRGVVRVEVRGERVLLRGCAVTVLTGELLAR